MLAMLGKLPTFDERPKIEPGIADIPHEAMDGWLMWADEAADLPRASCVSLS